MSNYRRKALEEHGEQCSNCGATEGIEIHHRNGDRTDNRVENLLPLCGDCHEKLHRSGIEGLEEELKPVSERNHIDDSTTSYQFQTDKQDWKEWKNTVPRSKPLDQRLRELIIADTEGRVLEVDEDDLEEFLDEDE